MEPKDPPSPRLLETLDDIQALPAKSPPRPAAPTAGAAAGPSKGPARGKVSSKAQDSPAAKATSARTDAPDTVSATRRLLLAAALAVGTAGAALPALFLYWAVFALLATGATAEALEHTGGLVPTTFGGGYALALGLDLAAVLWTVAQRILRRPTRWWPLTTLVLAYALVIWVLVPLELAGMVDVPDMITAFALLGADAMSRYVLPFVLLVMLGLGVRQVWRAGRASPAAAGRATAVAGCLGIAGITVAGAALAAGDRGYFHALVADASALGIPAATSVEGGRQSYEDLAAKLGPPAPPEQAQAADPERQGVAVCIEVLADLRTDEAGRRRAVVEAATARLIRDGVAKPAAEDLALAALLRVCEAQSEQDNLGKVVARFHEALDAQAGAGAADADAVRAALATLEAADQLVLEMRYIDNLSHADVGARLGQDETTTRLQARRALYLLQEAWQQELRGR